MGVRYIDKAGVVRRFGGVMRYRVYFAGREDIAVTGFRGREFARWCGFSIRLGSRVMVLLT